ncbi:MAG: hypothetical protein KDC11_13720 [Chitinophagaceae bacterium]|nr:hypothetical protein [Chitinophagaceae bacterium]
MNLFIGNLNPQTSEDSLRVAFAEFGEVISVKIPVDAETGMPRGFGFVEMTDKFEALDAIDNIDGIYFEGNVITVKESKPKGGGGRDNRRGGGGGGFRRNDRFGGDRDRGGYNRDRGGYNNDRGGYNSDRGGYNSDRGGYNSDRSDRGGYKKDNNDEDHPNRQPGRRFSPRGPRPDRDN